jgi:hypothetical protein
MAFRFRRGPIGFNILGPFGESVIEALNVLAV